MKRLDLLLINFIYCTYVRIIIHLFLYNNYLASFLIT